MAVYNTYCMEIIYCRHRKTVERRPSRLLNDRKKEKKNKKNDSQQPYS